MEVILREDMPSLGQAGDIVKVKDGFARNFLLPQKKAMVSTHKNLAALEKQRQALAATAAKLRQDAESIAERLSVLVLTISKEVGENGRLFGSVTNQDIVEALKQESIEIDRHKILLDHPIKNIGDHEVEVKLHPELKVQLKVTVVSQEEVSTIES